MPMRLCRIVRFIPLIAWKNGGENEVVVWHEVKDETEHLTHCQAKTVWMKQG